jgi:hypothetical protein
MLGELFRGKKYSVGKTGEKLREKHEGLPDSTLPHGLCPRCQKQSSFEVGTPQPLTFEPERFLRRIEAGASFEIYRNDPTKVPKQELRTDLYISSA